MTPLRRLGTVRGPEYPFPSSPSVSFRMQRNRSSDTSPERALRSALHLRGHRFRKQYKIETSIGAVRPDIVFPGKRVAVFVDGCFWHFCPEHGEIPEANRSYWEPKFARTTRRDRLVTRTLSEAGWIVIRVWEHETIEEAVEKVESRLGSRVDSSELSSA